MQTIVVVAVFVAITAQIISVIWGVFHAAAEFVRNRSKKKAEETNKRIEKSLREAGKNLDEINLENALALDRQRVNRSVTKQAALPVKIVGCTEETEMLKPQI